ncbi:hypothetical protein WJX72_004911 [[Myrmecia] bisecta]|uniref:Uncharacterized protein n=1 Tax=[Myrmecia] bisecta TaxID=41462 RepID=A0AAW1PBX0_9CHLO
MAATSSTSAFLGTQLPSRPTARISVAGRGRSTALPVQAAFGRRENETVERAKKSEAVRKTKLIPYDQKLKDAIPGKAKKMFNSRNTGGARDSRSQKTSTAVSGSQGLPGGVLAYAVILAGVFIAAATSLVSTNTVQ